MISTRHVFPNLGRELTSADIGKQILRTNPFVTNGNSDYTFMATAIDRLQVDSFTLLALSSLGATVLKEGKYYYVSREALIDNKWLTIDEFLEGMSNAVSSIHYVLKLNNMA